MSNRCWYTWYSFLIYKKSFKILKLEKNSNLKKGRILHLMNENLLNTTSIRIFVLDEADKLLAPEFQDSIKFEP